jgi:mannose-1-phosphate guanylyltransferase
LKSEKIDDAIGDKGARLFLPLKIGNTPKHLRNLEEHLPVFLSTVHRTKQHKWARPLDVNEENDEDIWSMGPLQGG